MDETTGSEYGRRADAVANREKVLVGARQAFADLGIHAEIKDIAERSGVGVGTIYRHFESKDGLLRAILHEAIDDFDAAMDRAQAASDVMAGIRAFLLAAMELVDTYGWLFDAMLGQLLPAPLVEDLKREQEDQRFEGLLRRAIEAGILREDLNAEIGARVLMGTLLTWKYGHPNADIDRAEAVDGVMAIFLHGAARR